MIFKLTEKDYKKLNEWNENHVCTLTYSGAIGGKFTYSFTPNSLGCVEKVICACGKSIDVTDYNW